MKKITFFLAAMMMIWSHILIADTPSSHEIGGKHLDAGLVCTDCHESAEPTKRAPMSACTSCHGVYADVAELTKNVEPNPHDSHQGELRCSTCHRTHEPSVNYCNECHEFDYNVK